MNFRLFFLQLIGISLIIQTVAFGMYSSSPVALRSFRSFNSTPPSRVLQDNVQEGWSSRLERMMNPQGFKVNRSVESEMPQAVLNPSVFKDVITQETQPVIQKPTFVASGEAGYLKSLRPDPNFVASMLANMNQFNLSENSLAQLKTKMADTLLFEDFYHRFMFEAQKLSTLNDRDSLQWYLMKNQELNELVNKFEKYDVSLQKKVVSLQTSIALRIEMLQLVADFEESITARAQANKEAEENRAYIRNGFALPSEEVQIPVENPYQQFKEDTKGQFYRGATLGGVGGGTLYGLQKRNKRK